MYIATKRYIGVQNKGREEGTSIYNICIYMYNSEVVVTKARDTWSIELQRYAKKVHRYRGGAECVN